MHVSQGFVTKGCGHESRYLMRKQGFPILTDSTVVIGSIATSIGTQISQ
ncbi:hypothetical protein [Paenibacillus allorhizoplanae]|nr:hypothetical protein [Paenibacillus allorhizoplanae]